MIYWLQATPFSCNRVRPILIPNHGLRPKKNSGRPAAVYGLTHKQLEMPGCMLSTVATDALVLKHQALSTHSSD